MVSLCRLSVELTQVELYVVVVAAAVAVVVFSQVGQRAICNHQKDVELVGAQCGHSSMLTNKMLLTREHCCCPLASMGSLLPVYAI